jgi:hypothetical protein
MLRRYALVGLSCLALLGASPQAVAPQAVQRTDASAMAVTGYINALSAGDYQTAYSLLTAAQQRYFGNVRNFASNATAAQTKIGKFTFESALSHGSIVEVVIREDVTFFDIATQQLVKASVREPYFALREGSAWRVKQLYQPWKSYAPNATAKTRGVSVTIARIEFYDKRVKVDCAIRNNSSTGVQILPLDKSVLDAGGERIAAMKEPQFPLNDIGFFEGLRLEPGHQAVGFINFPLARRDEAMRFMLALGPALQDGADQTFEVVVGPFELPKL